MVTRLNLMLTVLLFWSQITLANQIVASNRPLHSLVSGILEGITSPELLLPSSQSLHAQQMKPSQVLVARDATRVFWLGPEVEPDLIPFAESHWRDLSTAPDLIWRPARDWGERAATTEGALEGARDPHLWLDPKNGQALVRALTAEALALFPNQRARIEGNAQRYLERLDLLERSIRSQLEITTPRGYAVSHDAFQYFEARYDLSAQAILSRDPHAGTSAFRVRVMAAAIANAQVGCLFTEPAASSRVLQRLATEYEIPVIQLDPLGSSLTTGPDLYPALLSLIADGFLDCFQSGKP